MKSISQENQLVLKKMLLTPEEEREDIIFCEPEEELNESNYSFKIVSGDNHTVLKGYDRQVFHAIINPDGTYRWVWPYGLVDPSFLIFYNALSFKARLIKTAIRVLFYTGILERYVAKTVTVYMSKPPNYKKWLLTNTEQFSLFTGTVGPNRKILLEEKGKSGAVMISKIAFGPNAIKLIGNECKALNFLQDMESYTLTVPKVLRYDTGFLTVSALVFNSDDAQYYTSKHSAFLRELYSWNNEKRKVSKIPMYNRIMRNVEEISTTNSELIGLKTDLLSAWEAIKIEDKKVAVGFGHGDFTPWNCAVGHRLEVLDWEMSSDEFPLLYDLFHFIIQSAIMVDHLSSDNIFLKLEKIRSTEHVQRLLKEFNLNWKEQFDAYIMNVAGYYASVYADQSTLHPQAYWAIDFWRKSLHAIQLHTVNQTYRQTFIKRLFSELENKPYALMKNQGLALDDINEHSDIDLFIHPKEAKGILHWIQSQGGVIKLRISKKSYMTVVQLYFEDGSFLSIDFIHALKCRSWEYLTIDAVIQNANKNEEGVMIPQTHHDLEYIAVFYFINNAAIPEKYNAYLNQLYEGQQKSILHFLNHRLQLNLSRVEELFIGDYRAYAKIIWKEVKERKENKGISRVINQFQYLIDTVRNSKSQKGFIMTFSGVDGAGKSTVINHTRTMLEKKFRKQVIVLRHRPSLFPILSAWIHGKKAAEEKAASTLPRQGKNSSKLSSLLRFMYYLADYLIGQFYVYAKYTAKGYIVLYDRYYFDFIEDPKRTNLQLPRAFTRFFYRFIYKPEVNIFLHADVASILKRKQELAPEDIEHLTGAYKNLFKQFDEKYREQYIAIENEDLDKTLASIQKMVVTAA